MVLHISKKHKYRIPQLILILRTLSTQYMQRLAIAPRVGECNSSGSMLACLSSSIILYFKSPSSTKYNMNKNSIFYTYAVRTMSSVTVGKCNTVGVGFTSYGIAHQ